MKAFFSVCLNPDAPGKTELPSFLFLQAGKGNGTRVGLSEGPGENARPALKHTLMYCTLFCRCKRVKAPVLKDFDLSRYLGTWYEIARLHPPFEKGLSHVTARYMPLPKGKVLVVNRGFRARTGQWKMAKAKAVRRKAPNWLKVYFVPMFGGDYKVAYVDRDYTIAVVSGGNLKYLWFLARRPRVTHEERERMLAVAQTMGYDTSKLCYTPQ